MLKKPVNAQPNGCGLADAVLVRQRGVSKERQFQDGRIKWKQADALALPFEDQSLDVVACQFGIMFFLTRFRVISRRGESLSRAVASSLMYEIEFRRTSLLIRSRKRWRHPNVWIESKCGPFELERLLLRMTQTGSLSMRLALSG